MVDANAMDAVEVVGLRFAIVHTRHVMFAPPRRFGLAAAIPEVWIQFRKSSESRHMTVESVTLYRVQYV